MLKTFMLMFLLATPMYQNVVSADEQVMKAAEGQLDVYLDKISRDQLAQYGFTDKDDFDFCTVGKPFRILELNNAFFSDRELIDDKDYFIIKNEWHAPVLSNGRFCNMLTVAGNSGNYSVTAMGDPDLARELQTLVQGVDKNESFYILRIYSLFAEFFVHEKDNSFATAEFIPMESAFDAMPELKTGKKHGYSLAETERAIKEAMKKQPGKNK